MSVQRVALNAITALAKHRRYPVHQNGICLTHLQAESRSNVEQAISWIILNLDSDLWEVRVASLGAIGILVRDRKGVLYGSDLDLIYFSELGHKIAPHISAVLKRLYDPYFRVVCAAIKVVKLIAVYSA
jgi:hypothetical protein